MHGSLRGVGVLVTGATGFLGSHLTRRLVAGGARVTIMARAGSSFDRLADVTAGITICNSDLADASAIEQCLTRVAPDVVFHFAGETSGRSWTATGSTGDVKKSYDVNLGGTLHLLMAVLRAPGRPRVVRLGGLEEYGSGSLPFQEDQREAPVSPYSASQVAATHLAEMLYRRAGLRVVTLRPALVYGPDQGTSFFIPSLILASLAGRPFDMVSAGDQTRDLVFVEDVIEASILAALTPSIEGARVNVGSGCEYRIGDVAQLIRRLCGSENLLRVDTLSGRDSGLDRLVGNPGLARDLLGWEARTSIENGLTQSIAWYRARNSQAHHDRKVT